MQLNNIILKGDSYKLTHSKQYPPGTEQIYSYFESRGGSIPYTVFFGLQYIIKEHLSGQVVTQQMIQEAKEFAEGHFGTSAHLDLAGWQHILDKHQGRLPLIIKAVPEGMKVPTSNVLMTVCNTDERVPWLTNFVETLLVQAWYPTTVCSMSAHFKGMLKRFREETGCDQEGIDYQLHDFGFRGVSSCESAGIGGMAHQVMFDGTDTIRGIVFANKYYDAGICGVSVPASEHSTMTSWGKDYEADAYRNMLRTYRGSVVSVVSDSYDIFYATRRIWGDALKEEVKEHGRSGGKLVVRPDSGYPPSVVLNVVQILAEQFKEDLTTNEAGYRVLPPYVGVIQGDGIDYDMAEKILGVLKENQWAASNVVFGMGGGLLQKLDRDTQKFAFKCSAACVNGIWRDVYKQPATDSGKNSKRGQLKLVETVGSHGKTYETVSVDDDREDILEAVFVNGQMVRTEGFDEIRRRARNFKLLVENQVV